MLVCQFCAKECKSSNSHRNHERLCPKNSNRVYKSATVGATPWNKGLSKETDNRVALNADAIKRQGHLLGRCSDPEKEKIRVEKIKAACKVKNNGGYKENAGRSKKFKVVDSYGKSVCLQSTYELQCSEILNELNIRWIRPAHIKYDNKKYFPDFYLPEHDLYLDPKNDYKAKLDQEKIEKVIAQNNVRVVILLQHQLTKDFLKGLCS